MHAKILKHNILQVSKLRKLSHTTQAIDRHFEKNSSPACRSHSEDNCAHGEGNRCEMLSLQSELSTLARLKLSTWNGRLDLAELLLPYHYQHQSSSLRHPSPQHKALMSLSLSGLETLLLSSSTDSACQEFSPQENLSSVIKPVSYTADDIFTQPADVATGCTTVENILCNSQNVAVVTEHQDILRNDQTEVSNEHSDGDDCFLRFEALDLAIEDCPLHISDFDNSEGCVETVSPADTHLVLYSHKQRAKEAKRDPDDSQKGPSLHQLRRVEAYFIETLPLFFKTRMDYRIYHPEMVFENNFWGNNELFRGVNQYATQMMKFRAYTHLKYAHVHMEVMSSACLPEEGIVRVQWRIVGLSQFKALKFWKYTAWSYGKSFREDAEWIDGVSIFHVNKDGLVVKHRMDRMMPDEEQMVRKSPSLAGKLAILLGLSSPKPGLADCTSLFCQRTMLAQKLA